MVRSIAGVACAVAVCSVAAAQFAGGVNIDFNNTTGAGAGQPTIVFAGAAGQGGYWNPVSGPFTVGVPRAIRNLGNSADAVTLTVVSATATGAFSFNNANTSGDSELLLDDIHDLGAAGAAAVYSIGPFAAGTYEVYTYAVAPDNATYITAVSAGDSALSLADPQNIGGAIPAGGAFTQGVTHARHTISLAAPGSLFVRAATVTGFGAANGLQVRPVPPTRLYVNQAAPAAGQTGLSWAHAYRDLQTAVASAAVTPTVSEVWVAQGRYMVDSLAPGNRDATLTVRNGLALRGGFVGSEATREERGNPRAFAHWTIIDGSVGTYADQTDDVRHCVTATSANCTLDGFLVLLGSSGSWGAGVVATGGNMLIQDCIFSSNSGAAIYGGSASLSVADCTFTSCRGNGAAFFINDGSATFDRCRFTRGNSGSFCAGVGRVGGAVVMANCLIDHNTSGCGGNLELDTGGSLSLYNCTITDNTGGGSQDPAVGMYSGTNIIRNCVIWNNRTPGFGLSVQAQQVQRGGTATLEISDSIVEGWDGTLADAALANFSADPRFIDPDGANNSGGDDDDNYRLASRSPARDSGWFGGLPALYNVYDFTHSSTRVFDDPYFANTGFASAANPIDRGCYEAQSFSAVCPGDLGATGGVPGADGARDNNDFIVFIDYFFAHDPLADVGRVGGVPGSDLAWDNNDFVVYIDMFFTLCP